MLRFYDELREDLRQLITGKSLLLYIMSNVVDTHSCVRDIRQLCPFNLQLCIDDNHNIIVYSYTALTDPWPCYIRLQSPGLP